MTKIEQFFYEHGGYAVAPTETEQQARERCARELAAAEAYARERNWVYEWEPDGMPCDHSPECEETPECCLLWNEARTDLLASLCGICGATDNYRRVVEAELAQEAMGQE